MVASGDIAPLPALVNDPPRVRDDGHEKLVLAHIRALARIP